MPQQLSLAEFVSIEWDDARRVCTIQAHAAGASKILISAGYTPNAREIKTKEVTGEDGSMAVEDLDHGEGQLLYLSIIPFDESGEQRTAYGAWKTIPIPNPILGVAVNKCDSEEAREYIVDIIEHKTDGQCTTRWQNGDRVVEQGACFGSLTYTNNLDGTLDGGTTTYFFQNQNEFDRATSHNRGASPTAEYPVGKTKVALQRMVGVKIGSKITSLSNGFMCECPNFNCPLRIPSNVKNIRAYFLYNCTLFNSPVAFPKKCNFSGHGALMHCHKFNSPIILPEEITNSQEFGYGFLEGGWEFNQPVVLPRNITALGNDFMSGCSKFNSDLIIPDTVTSCKGFLNSCRAFNQPLPFVKNLVSIEFGYFLVNCKAFNQPLNFENLVTVGGRVVSECDKFNSPILFPKLKTLKGADGVLTYNPIFNQPVDFPALETLTSSFVLNSLSEFNSPVTFPALTEINAAGHSVTALLANCRKFNQPLNFPTLQSMTLQNPPTGNSQIAILDDVEAFASSVSMPLFEGVSCQGALTPGLFFLRWLYSNKTEYNKRPKPQDCSVEFGPALPNLGEIMNDTSMAVTISNNNFPTPPDSKITVGGVSQASLDSLPNKSETRFYRNLVLAS